MRAVIGVANVARGVGKTATAVSLAAELARRGFETLLIDADPQAEATAHLLDPDDVGLTVADLLLGADLHGSARAEVPRLGLEGVLVPTCIPRLRLAPSGIRLATGEGDTPLGPRSLSAKLADYEHPYDFALVDTPSSLGPLTAACVFVSTHLLVPVMPGTQGVQGLRYLMEKLKDMSHGRGPVELLGIVCNLFDCRSHSSGAFYEALKLEWGEKVLGTKVHCDPLIEGGAGRRLPVQAYAPTSSAAALYAALADELMTRLDVAVRAEASIL